MAKAAAARDRSIDAASHGEADAGANAADIGAAVDVVGGNGSSKDIEAASAAQLLAAADPIIDSEGRGYLATFTVVALCCVGAVAILSVLFFKKKGRWPWDNKKGGGLMSPQSETKYDV